MESEPDFLILIEGGRKTKEKIALYVACESGLSDNTLLDEIRIRALEVGVIKRSYEEIEAVLVACASRNDEEGQQILELEVPPYFDKVFFEDELSELKNYIEKRRGNIES